MGSSRTFGCVRLVCNRALEVRTTAWSQERRRVGCGDTSASITAGKRTDELGVPNEVSPLPSQQCPRHQQVAVSRDPAGRWHASMLVETSIGHLAPLTTAIGVDAGLTPLLTPSTGEAIANPRQERRERVASARARRDPAREAKGSDNRDEARTAVARVHARIAGRRRDPPRRPTARLVRGNPAIVVEDLAVRNTVRNRSSARAISDASWSGVRSVLTREAAWCGRTVIAVDRWHPSGKTCSRCRRVLDTPPSGVREWTCPGRGEVHDRDVTAARDIPAAGRAVAARGDGVGPNRCQWSVGHLSEPPFRGRGNRNRSL